MLFFMGLVDADNGDRHVLVGRSLPSIDNMEALTGNGQSFLDCDWGETAGDRACKNVARMVLKRVLNGALTENVVTAYAQEVVAKMRVGTKWMTTDTEIKEWLTKRQVQ